MPILSFADAIDKALARAMAQDDRIVIWGEDVEMIRVNLFSRFGKKRVRNTPISECAFLGAAVAAAMTGLRPVVEIMLVDFIGVAFDAVLNHAAKTESFSGGMWKVPLVVRTSCGGGYGDGGQHEQALWGLLAHIPGLSVVVPSTPADAAGLMLAAIEYEGPVVFLEHKLLADYWLDYLGGNSRKNVHFDVPAEGARGTVPKNQQPIPLGRANLRRKGKDLTIVSLGASLYRSLEAADVLERRGIAAEVLDLRTAAPLDREAVCNSIMRTGRLLVVDEDYRDFGLSGEVAATALEAGIFFQFARVCTETTIPYARELEENVLPNSKRIIRAAEDLMKK